MEINIVGLILKGCGYGLLISLCVGFLCKGLNYAIKLLKM